MASLPARLSLGLSVAALSLGLAELGLRASGRSLAALVPGGAPAVGGGVDEPVDVQPRLARPDPLLGFALIPGQDQRHRSRDFDVRVRTGAHGLRDDDQPRRPADGGPRLLVLGDSFSFGWGVEREQTFVQQLEVALGPGSAVINGGQPGWSPDRLLLWSGREGLDWDVDLLLVQVSLNDLDDLGQHEIELGADLLPLRAGTVSAFHGLDEALLRRACEELGLDVEAQRERFLGGTPDGTQRQVLRRARELAQADGDPLAGRPVAGRTPAQVVRGLIADEAFRAAFLIHLLEALERHWAERGVPVRWMLVDWPEGQQREGSGRLVLRRWFAERGDRALDLSQAFDASPGAGDYFDHDPHWTPRAHAEAARRLAAWLGDDPAWNAVDR